jgi:hypothetical protein
MRWQPLRTPDLKLQITNCKLQIPASHPIEYPLMAKRLRSLRCPNCKQVVSRKQPEFPFCSERCRLIDLGKWASGAYVISTPAQEADQYGEAYTPGNSQNAEPQVPRGLKAPQHAKTAPAGDPAQTPRNDTGESNSKKHDRKRS